MLLPSLPQSTYIYRVQSSVWRLPNYFDPPPALNPASVSSPRIKGGGVHTRRAVRVGSQYFGRRQTLDWPHTVQSLYALCQPIFN